MSQYKDFTSLPPEQEQTFVVFEQRSVEAGQKAFKLAVIVSGILGLLTMIIVLGVSPGESTAEKMDSDELSKGGGMLSGESEVAKDKKDAPDAPAAAATDDDTKAEGDGDAKAEGDTKPDGEAKADDEAKPDDDKKTE